jgi:hypothetical protein
MRRFRRSIAPLTGSENGVQSGQIVRSPYRHAQNRNVAAEADG